MASGDEFQNITGIVRNINNLKEQIAELDLNPRLRVYYDDEVSPLLGALNDFENEAANFAEAAKDIALILKKSDIKVEKDLVLDVINQGIDVYKELEEKIDALIEIGKNT